jgi:hypothetical protein
MDFLPIPSISVEGLLAARDRTLQAFAQIKTLLDGAQADMGRFAVRIPRVDLLLSGGFYRCMQDESIADVVRKDVDRLAWARLFQATNVELLMDSKTRRELQQRLHTTAQDSRHDGGELPDLTEENIRSTFERVHADRQRYFELCVESVYRSLSWDHKTNTPGLIGGLLIMRGLFYPWSRNLQGSCTSLQHHDGAQDLERVLCILDGQPPPTYSTGLYSMRAVPWGVWTEVPHAGRTAAAPGRAEAGEAE